MQTIENVDRFFGIVQYKWESLISSTIANKDIDTSKERNIIANKRLNTPADKNIYNNKR